MYIDSKEIVEAGEFVLKNREKLLPMLRKMRSLLRYGRISVVIFGPGGTGKTELGTLLSADFKQHSRPGKFTESLDRETYRLKGDLVCELIVAPGQEKRRAETWPELYRRLATGKVRVVINVVSWGYHAFADLGYQEAPHFQPGMSVEEFMAKHVVASRETEMKVIQELTPHLTSMQDDLRMITLVTKQDLWWGNRQQVRDFYEQRAYNDCIQDILKAKGAQHFRHEYLSASLVMRNLTDVRGELLASTTAGYDETLFTANLDKMINTLNSLAKARNTR